MQFQNYPFDRVVKWAENQIVLVAKLRSNFQNQIVIAKNCDFLILDLKITQKPEFRKFAIFAIRNFSANSQFFAINFTTPPFAA